MDNITHSLLGAALSQAGLNRVLSLGESRGASGGTAVGNADTVEAAFSDPRRAITAMMILAANLPDLDVATLPAPLYYLEHHRGYTHTCWGIAVLALLLPLPFLKWNRAIHSNPSPVWKKYLYLAGISLVGTASHLLLDFANSYGVRPFRPFSQRWLYGDFIPIIDPWIYLILGSSLFLIGAPGKWRNLLWAGGIAAVSLAVLFYGRTSPIDPLYVARTVWFVMVSAILAARWMARRRLMRMAQGLVLCSLFLLCGYYLLCWQLHRTALTRLRSVVAAEECRMANPLKIAATPVAGTPFRWTFFVESVDQYCRGQFQLAGSAVSDLHSISKNLAGVPYQRAAATCAGKVILRFARFPVLNLVERPDGYAVNMRDLRFAPLPQRIGFTSVSIYFDRQWRERPDSEPVCPWSEAFRLKP